MKNRFLKTIYLIPILLGLALYFWKPSESVETPNTSEVVVAEKTAPQAFDFLPTSTTNQIIQHQCHEGLNNL